MVIASPNDFRDLARRCVPRFLFDYADGGANAEITLRRNVSDLAEVLLPQRVLAGPAEVDLRTTLFGHSQSLPVILGPVGIAGMYRRRGETLAARAAAEQGVPFCLSTVSLCSLEEVARAAGKDHLWFQLYVIRDRGFMRELLQAAKSVGVQALVFTVDMPVPGSRYRDARSGMSGRYAPLRRFLQACGKPRWAWDVGIRGRPHQLGNLPLPQPLSLKGEGSAYARERASGLNDYMGWLARNFDPSIRWQDLEWIRESWSGPLIIKGILEPDDARSAAALGADGIVVSNHGARQLDSVMSSVRALPAIADAVGHRLTILADSGVRSGLDVLKMMRLGAKGVLLGRAWLFALAAQGQAGVARLLELIEQEMRVGEILSPRPLPCPLSLKGEG
jgi:L-lactate dehydrogenase (cytochrome)